MHSSLSSARTLRPWPARRRRIGRCLMSSRPERGPWLLLHTKNVQMKNSSGSLRVCKRWILECCLISLSLLMPGTDFRPKAFWRPHYYLTGVGPGSRSHWEITFQGASPTLNGEPAWNSSLTRLLPGCFQMLKWQRLFEAKSKMAASLGIALVEFKL